MPIEIRELVIRATVITVSDACSRGERKDTSGEVLVQLLLDLGAEIVATQILADDLEPLAAALLDCSERSDVNLIITTGGTGFAPRDVTPEAIKPLCTREMDGFTVLFHQASHGTVGLSTLQSRAFAGQIGDTFIFCLPGSTGACRDGWDHVLRDELDSRYRPCSLAGLVPRLRDLVPS